MKTALFIVLAFFAIVFTSCNKEDFAAPRDDAQTKKQTANAPLPTSEKISAFIAGNKLKSGNFDLKPVVTVAQIDSRNIIISGDKATRFLLVYELLGINRTKEITLSEEFTIKKDGSIDPTSGQLKDVLPGCPYKSDIYIDSENLQGVTQICNFQDGRQISFAGTLIDGHTVKLPAIEGAVWQLKVGYFDGDMYQEFMTEPINLYAPTNRVKLKIEAPKDNIVSYIQISKKLLKSANLVQIFFEDLQTGDITSYVEFYPAYDETLPEYISFGIPIEYANRVNIYTPNYRQSLSVNPVLNTQINGKPVYRAE